MVPQSHSNVATLMVDQRLLWNLVYIARDSRRTSPTPPMRLPRKITPIQTKYETLFTIQGATEMSTVTTQNASMHMKRCLQYAKEQDSASNFTNSYNIYNIIKFIVVPNGILTLKFL